MQSHREFLSLIDSHPRLKPCSGPIDTPMIRSGVVKEQGSAAGATPPWQIKREGKPEEVAALIAWLLSPMSKYITGTVQTIDGGWTC